MKYAIIGFGEAGSAICADWSAKALAATKGFDLKSADPANGMTTRFTNAGITEAMSAAEAVAQADVILSLVTADQAPAAAQSAVALNQGALYLECNSVSPASNAKTLRSLRRRRQVRRCRRHGPGAPGEDPCSPPAIRPTHGCSG